MNNMKKLALVALAISLVTACGDKDPEQSAKIHIDRAKAYQEHGQYKASAIEYKNALKNNSGDVEAVVAYANMLNELGHNRAAKGTLESFSGERSQAYYLELAEALLGMKKYHSSKTLLDENVTQDDRRVTLLEAETMIGLNELDKASVLYDSLLRDNSVDGEALVGKAGILLRQEGVADAKKLLLSVPKDDGAYVAARTLMAGLAITEEHLEEGESILTELLTLLPNTDMMQPEKALVLERLSYVLTRLGRSNEAYIYTKLLSEAFPGVNEMNEQYAQAVNAFKEGDMGESARILKNLVDAFPANQRAAQLLGVVTYLQGDHEEAIEYFSGNVDPEVDDPLTTQLYVASQLRVNEPKKVLELLKNTIEQSQSSETLALYSLAAMSDKQYLKAEKAAKKAIQLDPENYKLHLLLAAYYRDRPQPDADLELESLTKAHKYAPVELQVLKDLLSFYLRIADDVKAKKFVSDQLSTHGNAYSSQLIAGYFKASKGLLGGAITHFSTAALLEKEGIKHRNALFALGRVQGNAARSADARKTFMDMISKFPDDRLGYQGLFSVITMESDENAFATLEHLAKDTESTMAYKILIQAALARKDTEKAKHYLSLANAQLEPDASNDEELLSLGQSVAVMEAVQASEQAKYDDARELIAPVLLADPDNPRVLSFLIDMEIKAGNLQEAGKVLDQLKVAQQNSALVSVLSGDLALAKQDLEQARSHYQTAWAENKTEVVAGKLYRMLGIAGDPDAKTALLEEWASVLPNSVNATFFKAMDDQTKGNVADSKAGYERVLSVRPNDVTVLNNLGWLYFEEGNKEALKLLAKASELAPENAAVLDSYGWALAEFGQPEEGLAYLEKASKLAPESEEIAKHYSEVKAKLGR